MDAQDENLPDVTDNSIFRLILTGRAKNLDEAEEIYLDESLPDILELLAKPIPDEELARHPLMTLLRFHGSRGWEDSLL
jgi:hypothetical protein